MSEQEVEIVQEQEDKAVLEQEPKVNLEQVIKSMLEQKTKIIYADALKKIQFNSNNIKLSFVEIEDLGGGKLEYKEVVKIALSTESAIKMVNELAKFLNNLANAKAGQNKAAKK